MELAWGNTSSSMQEEFRPPLRSRMRDSKHAIEIVVHFANRGSEFFPEDVLLGSDLREAWRRKKQER